MEAKWNDEGEGAASSPAPTGLVGDSLAVAAWTVISRIMGFAKVAGVAAVLGPTYLGNTFQALNSLPNLLSYGLLAGALFPSLLVPALVRHIDARDTRAANRVAGGFLGVAVLVFALAGIVAVLAGPALLQALSFGVNESEVAVAQQRVGWPLLVMLMPQVCLYAVIGTGAAVMNARGQFALPAAAPALESIGIVATLAAYAAFFGTDTALDEVEMPHLMLLGLGTTGAVALHAAVQWLGARRVGITLVPRQGWRDPEVRQVISRAVPSLGYGALVVLQLFGALVVANSLPGGVVAFQLAWNLVILPGSIAARPVASALLPRLARIHVEGDKQHFRDEVVRSLRLALFLTVPAAMAYLALASPLARSVSFGQMAAPTAVALVAATLAALAPGIVGETYSIIATNASYAYHDARSPFASMGLQTFLSLGGMLLALSLEGTVVLVVLGLSLSVASLVASAHLMSSVWSRLPAHGERLIPSLVRTVVASAMMVGPAYLVAVLVPKAISGQWGQPFGMVISSVVGLCVFVGIQRLWNSQELTVLVGGLGQMPRARDRGPTP